MIIITKVEHIEVPDDIDHVMTKFREQGFHQPISFDNKNGIAFETYTESIRGIKFQRRDGTQVRIGYSKDVYDILGISAEAFDGLHEALQAEQEVNRKLRNEVYKSVQDWSKIVDLYMEVNVKIDCASFWSRLKYLFTRNL